VKLSDGGRGLIAGAAIVESRGPTTDSVWSMRAWTGKGSESGTVDGTVDGDCVGCGLWTVEEREMMFARLGEG
jgi:hypothetical protein